MQGLGPVVFGHGGFHVWQHRIGADAGVQILLKKRAEGVPVFRPEEVKPQVGRTDMVGFLNDQITALIETLGRPEKGEANEQAEQGKDGGIDNADELLDRTPADFLVPASHAVTDFHGKEQGKSDAKKNGKGQQGSGVRTEEGDGEHA